MKFSQLRWLFSFGVLFLATSPLLHVLEPQSAVDPTQVSESNVFQVLWLLVYLCTGLMLLPRLNTLATVLSRDVLLLLLVALALLSSLWSINLGITLRRSIALLGTTIVAGFFVITYRPSELIRLLTWVLGFSLLLSVAVITVVPEIGLDQKKSIEGAWRGIYHQKSLLGRYAALAILVTSVQLAQTDERFTRWILRGLLGIALFITFYSNSATAIIATVAGVGLLQLFRISKFNWSFETKKFILIFLSLLVISLTFILWLSHEQVLALLGRDISLTGRAQLWPLLVGFIADAPLGYGYGAFWFDRNLVITEIWRFTTWTPRHAHNGFLQLGLYLGWPAVAIFVIHLVRTLRRALRYASRSSLWRTWPLIFLIFFVLFNVTEAMVLERNNILWLLYTIISLQLAVQFYRRPQQQHRRSGSTVQLPAAAS